MLTQVIKETWMARPDYKQKKLNVKAAALAAAMMRGWN